MQETLSQVRPQKRTEPPEDYSLSTLELKASVEVAQEEARALRDELEALIVQMEKLRTQTIETEQENHLLRHTLLTTQKTCNDLKQETVDLRTEHVTHLLTQQTLQEELAVLQEENVKLQDQQTQLRHSLTESQTLCHAHQTTYNALKQNYETLQDDLKNNQQALIASHVEQERIEAKATSLLHDHQNLIVALSNLTEGFHETQTELLFAKQLLIEKTEKSANFFLLQEEAALRIKQLEETLKAEHQTKELQQSTIEKLQQSESQLTKRLEEETIRAHERAALFKRDYTQVLHQAQAAQEELNRYRALQERLLPLQHFLLQHHEKTTSTASSGASSSNSTLSPIDFQDGAWEEERYAHGYRTTKTLFTDF